MASHIPCHSHLFVILALVAVGSTVLVMVEGSGTCSETLGACGPAGDCNQRCKAKHNGGQGSCDLNLCNCYYSCPPERKCTSVRDLCTLECMDSCCNAKCASQYNQGVGFCNQVNMANFCTCQYVCSSHLHK